MLIARVAFGCTGPAALIALTGALARW